MRDLCKELLAAKEKHIFENICDFESFVQDIMDRIDSCKIDWDYEVGEEWAFLYREESFQLFRHTKIGIGFLLEKEYVAELHELTSKIHIVETNSFDDPEWFLDVEQLKKELKEISWLVSEHAVDPNHICLRDFYVVTV